MSKSPAPLVSPSLTLALSQRERDGVRVTWVISLFVIDWSLTLGHWGLLPVD